MKQFTEDVITLIISEISGSITPQEQDQLNNLMKKYPQVRELSNFLHDSSDTDETAVSEPTEEEANEIIQLIKHRIRKKKITNNKRLFTWAAAACVLVIAGICGVRFSNRSKITPTGITKADMPGMYLLIGNKKYDLSGSKRLSIDTQKRILLDNKERLNVPKDASADVTCKIVVPAKLVYAVTLSDGTSVTMNSASEMTFPLLFPKHSRSVQIKGEAYVKVSASPSWKFTVYLPATKVDAYGTEFNVNSYDSGVEKIALIKGNVTVTSSNRSKELKPGYAATIVDSTISVDTFNNDDVTSWLSGVIYLSNIDEQDIVDAAKRYYDKKIVIERPSNGEHYFIIIKRNQPIEYMLKQLTDTSHIRKIDGVYYIN